MRAILDTNVLISALLSHSGTMKDLIEHAARGHFQPVILEEVEKEFFRSIGSKPYLQLRTTPEEANAYFARLRAFSESVPRLLYPALSYSRDANDNFLVAHALMLDVDFLVTGDKDLLVLRHFLERPRIVPPAAFLELLISQSED